MNIKAELRKLKSINEALTEYGVSLGEQHEMKMANDLYEAVKLLDKAENILRTYS